MKTSAVSGDIARQFIGTWSLIAWTQTSPDGETNYPMGEDAVGRILYSADGHMAAHIMCRQRTLFQAEDSEDPSLEERAAVYLEYFSYAGSYTVQQDAKTVTHHVAVARDPDWISLDLVRTFQFEEKSLLLVSDKADGTTNRLVWERL